VDCTGGGTVRELLGGTARRRPSAPATCGVMGPAGEGATGLPRPSRAGGLARELGGEPGAGCCGLPRRGRAAGSSSGSATAAARGGGRGSARDPEAAPP